MIRYSKDDLWESKAQTIVNPCNCVGIAGAGLSLAFKTIYPANYAKYVDWCKNGAKPGDILLYKNDMYPHWILNFPTKNDWRNLSRIEYIEAGLKRLVNKLHTDSEYRISSIAMPKIGCGLGGLAWKDVEELIFEHLDNQKIRVILHI